MYALSTVFLCIALISQQPKKPTATNNHESKPQTQTEPQQRKTDGDRICTYCEINAKQEKTQQQKDEDEKDRRYQRIYWFSTIAGVAIALGTVIALICQTKATRDAAKGAIKSAIAADKNATALMGIERCWLTPSHKGVYSIGKTAYVDVKFTNTGNTRATITDLYGSFRSAAKSSDVPAEPVYEVDPELPAVPLSINKGGYALLQLKYRNGELDWQKAKRGELFVYFYARVEYSDIFGATHETRTAYSLSSKDWDFTDQFGGPKYNIET